jgi:hypothetical protein
MSDDTSRQLPLVCILRQGRYLIATVHAALDDGQLTRFQHDPSSRSAGSTLTAWSST